MHRRTTLHTSWQRIVFITCALVIAASMGAAAQIELEIWGNSNHLEAVKPIIEEFNASQDRIVVTIPGKNESPETILTAYAANLLPDIIESGDRWTQTYARQGLLADLTPFIERERGDYLEQFFPATLYRSSTLNGRFYALPLFLEIEGAYYNENIFEESGVASPQPGWTWQDLADISRQTRRYNADGTRDIWGIVADTPRNLDWQFLAHADARFVNDDLEVVVNSEPVRETYRWILDMMDRDLLTSRWSNIHPGAVDARAHDAAVVLAATYRQNYLPRTNRRSAQRPRCAKTLHLNRPRWWATELGQS